MEIGSAYGRLWSIQQLCPFADAGLNALGLLGAAGAVDARPILSNGDFYVRLPLCLLTLFYPTRNALLLAHVVNLAAFCAWTPFVWDHQYWGAATEATFVLLSMRSESDFVGAARAQTASLYLVAAFWKLTTSFLDYRTSCATVLVAEALTPVLLAALRSAASLSLTYATGARRAAQAAPGRCLLGRRNHLRRGAGSDLGDGVRRRPSPRDVAAPRLPSPLAPHRRTRPSPHASPLAHRRATRPLLPPRGHVILDQI